MCQGIYILLVIFLNLLINQFILINYINCSRAYKEERRPWAYIINKNKNLTQILILLILQK